jgi:glycosyltransferase involved in cell wall biosynthesis
MTHIGIDARLIHYRAGGTSTYIRALLAEFAQDSENRYTVIQSRKQAEPIVSGLRHVRSWTPPHHRLERVALSAELLRLRLDVLHSPDFIPPYRGARRHVITVHDLAFLIYPEQMTEESKRYYNGQIRAAVAKADHILSVSEATRQDLIDMLGVPHDKITVQYHGVEPAFRPLPEDQILPTLRAHGLSAGYFLFVGTIGPRKNIPGLLAGYARLREQFRDAPPLVIAGEVGWLADDLLKTIRSAAGVVYLGGVAWRDFPALYNGSRALLLPSHYEGFGLPALEAMACGIIPVVSDRSSLPEVTGGVGLLVNPDEPDSLCNALATILVADATWLAQQREAAVARAAQFTWARSAEIAREVYTKVALR